MTRRSPTNARSSFWHAHQVDHPSSGCKLLNTLFRDIQHFFSEFKFLGFNTFLMAVMEGGSCSKKTSVAFDFWITSSIQVCLFPYLSGAPSPALMRCQQPRYHPSPTSHLCPWKCSCHHRLLSCSVCRLCSLSAPINLFHELCGMVRSPQHSLALILQGYMKQQLLL